MQTPQRKHGPVRWREGGGSKWRSQKWQFLKIGTMQKKFPPPWDQMAQGKGIRESAEPAAHAGDGGRQGIQPQREGWLRCGKAFQMAILFVNPHS